MSGIETLASYRRGIEHMRAAWPAFLEKRAARLEQMRRHGVAAERVAENIVEDLLTGVLDWRISDLNNQIDYADLVVTENGIKQLLIETKRPGALAWSRSAVERALDQALRYAAEQRVSSIAISDGFMLYAADVRDGGLRDRVFASLESPAVEETLWWLSVHGIYRPRTNCDDAALSLLPQQTQQCAQTLEVTSGTLLHPKYQVPASCFAYVGNAADPGTWKLPYRLVDGSLDAKRLPKAIQAILSNYRGAKLRTVPEAAIPDVLVRLARGAASLGKMPYQCGQTSDVYCQLETALNQLQRLEEIKKG